MELFSEILVILLSSIFSGIISLLICKYEINKAKKDEKFEKFYKRFWILRDSIHQGRAYNFTDLTNKQQEQIVQLLIETDCYQNEEILNLVYELKITRLNNFSNQSEDNINVCNNLYNILSEKIMEQYMKYK